MKCPKCGGKTKVIDNSRINGDLYRRRRCTVCDHDFYTAETVVENTTSMRSAFRIYNRRTAYYDNKRKGESKND